MINTDEKVNIIIEYLLDTMNLTPEAIRSIKTAINLVHEISSTDVTIIFKKMDEIIAASEDLSWVIQLLKRAKSKISVEYKNIRDPEFTSLTRKGRPSTIAVESEIRFNHPEVVNMEENMETVSGIIDYLQHVELCLDRRIWAIKDRISLSKM